MATATLARDLARLGVSAYQMDGQDWRTGQAVEVSHNRIDADVLGRLAASRYTGTRPEARVDGDGGLLGVLPPHAANAMPAVTTTAITPRLFTMPSSRLGAVP
jgi:hypothetical protein